MSKGIKNRLISGLLTFAMVLSFVPSISFSRSVEVDAAEKDISTLPNITMLTTEIDETGFTSEDALKAARLQAVEKDAGTTGLKLVASGQKSGFTTYMWHYSGGYWGANYKPIVYDSELINSEHGIGTMEDVIKLNDQTFQFNVYEGSAVYDAIETGEQLYINLTPNSDHKKYGITLSDLFTVEVALQDGKEVIVKDKDGNVKGMSCKIEGPTKVNGKNAYTLKFTMNVKLNYWPYEDINFNKTYNLNLAKHVPFVKNGYGKTMFAMWTPEGNEVGAAIMWYNENDPWSLEGMPKGYIHPTMIKPFNRTVKYFGKTFSTATTANWGGTLYEKSPIFNSVNTVEDVDSLKDNGTWSYDKAIEYLLDQDITGSVKTFDVTKDNIAMSIQKKNIADKLGVPLWSQQFMPPSFANIGHGTFAGAGAVGLYFDFNVDLDIYVKEKTKVVASYVQIVGYENGEPIYETVMDSELLDDVDVENYIANLDANRVIEDKDGSTYLGILNDVVTSHIDLGEAKDVDWSKDMTPETSTQKVEQNAKDVDYYRFGIITKYDEALYEHMADNGYADGVTVDNNMSSRYSLSENVSYLEDKVTLNNYMKVDAAVTTDSRRDSSAYWATAVDRIAAANSGAFKDAVKEVGSESESYQDTVDMSSSGANKEIIEDKIEEKAALDPSLVIANTTASTVTSDIVENGSLMSMSNINPEDFGRVNYDYFSNILVRKVEKILINTYPEGETSSNGNSAGVGGTQSYTFMASGLIHYAVELNNPLNVPITPIEPIQVATTETFTTQGSAVEASNDICNHVEEIEEVKIELSKMHSLALGPNARMIETDDSLMYVESLDMTDIEEKTENVVYLRYIVYPDIVQKNKINIIENGVTKSVVTFQQPVTTVEDNGGTVDVLFNDISIALRELSETGTIELEKWVTSDDNVPVEDLKTRDLPPADTHSGTDIPEIIEDVPIIEDIYAEWNIIIETGQEYGDVPEWRLSKLDEDGFDNPKLAGMSLTLRSDLGCFAPYSYLTPSGTYNYWLLNPNETREDGVNKNYKVVEWLHSQAFDYGGTYEVTHSKPWVEIPVNAKTNLIKATKDSNHVLANWLETEDLYSYYDIQSGSKPLGNISSKTYTHTSSEPNAEVDVGLENKNKYTHYYGKDGGCCGCCLGGCGCGDDEDDYCNCGSCSLPPESLTPAYSDAIFDLTATFNRYKIQGDKVLSVNSDVQEKNGLTTIKYQLKDTDLTVYPEYGMLFEKDNADESIKWVIGDTARVINPVVWQTLQHKVYVKPTSTGSSVATDSRGITKANSIGESGKQIIYKGAGVNTNFRLYQSKDSNKVALMTVKTYALDFKNDSNYSKFNGASGWNTGYKSYDEHNALLDKIQAGENSKATVTEKLLVDTTSYGGTAADFEGAVKTVKSNPYKLVTYKNSGNIKVADGSNGEAVVFEHELIIRGGYLIGVRMDKHNGSKELITIDNLKSKAENDPFSDYAAFYNALVGMNLYDENNKKDNTVFKGFLHKPQDSQTLNEGVYATKLASARSSKDGIATPSYAKITEGDKWYSEDTTVLIVCEYVSNFEVPSVSISDKLPMTINQNLNTPANKSQFFSELGKGYLYLNYNLSTPISDKANLGKNVNATFTYTSFPGDIIDTENYSKTGDNTTLDNTKKFGEQVTNYLVPNVSITDTTRMN